MLELAYYAQNNASVLWQSLPLFSRAPENEAILKLAPRYGRVCALRIYPLFQSARATLYSYPLPHPQANVCRTIYVDNYDTHTTGTAVHNIKRGARSGIVN